MGELATMVQNFAGQASGTTYGPDGWVTTVTEGAGGVAEGGAGAGAGSFEELIGGGLKAGAQIGQGMMAKQGAKFEAKQLQQKAGEERAAAQREAQDRRRKTQLVISKQVAGAAASGAGASGAGIIDIIGDTAQHGEYQARSDMFLGEQRARGLEDEAAATRAGGNNALTGSILEGITTGISNVGKYRKARYG